MKEKEYNGECQSPILTSLLLKKDIRKEVKSSYYGTHQVAVTQTWENFYTNLAIPRT